MPFAGWKPTMILRSEGQPADRIVLIVGPLEFTVTADMDSRSRGRVWKRWRWRITRSSSGRDPRAIWRGAWSNDIYGPFRLGQTVHRYAAVKRLLATIHLGVSWDIPDDALADLAEERGYPWHLPTMSYIPDHVIWKIQTGRPVPEKVLRRYAADILTLGLRREAGPAELDPLALR